MSDVNEEAIQRSYLRRAIKAGARLTVGESGVFVLAEPGMGDLLKLAGFEFVEKKGYIERYTKSSGAAKVEAAKDIHTADTVRVETKPEDTPEANISTADTVVVPPAPISPESTTRSQRRKSRE